MENKSPFELWYGKSSSIKNLKIFGTECFVHIPSEKRRKLDKKAIPGYLVGLYLDNNQGYRIYIPSTRKIILSRDVLFKPERVIANSVILNVSKNKKDITNNLIDDNNIHSDIQNERENADGKQFEENLNKRQ